MSLKGYTLAQLKSMEIETSLKLKVFQDTFFKAHIAERPKLEAELCDYYNHLTRIRSEIKERIELLKWVDFN